MTYLEILEAAQQGISAQLKKEEDVNQKSLAEFGEPDIISTVRIERLEKQWDEVRELIVAEGQKGNIL